MRDERHRSTQSVGLPLLVAVLTSCSIGPSGQKTPMHTYLLSLDSSPATASVVSCGPGTATLLVNVPRAQAGFNSSRMAYLRQPNEVSYYAQSQWADTPARLLAPLLVQAMEQTGCWKTVVLMPTTVQGDYRLDTEILHWQQEFFSQPSRVRLTLRAQLVEQRSQQVVASQRFEVVEEAPSEDAQGGVIATNRAVRTLLQQVAQQISAARRDASRQPSL